MSAWEEKIATGKVLYDFKANGCFQLDLFAGEKVAITKVSSGWYRGKVLGRTGVSEKECKGIFPVSFIQIEGEEDGGKADKEGKETKEAPAKENSANGKTEAAAATASPTSEAAPVASSASATPTGNSVANSPFLRMQSASGSANAASPLTTPARKQWPPQPPSDNGGSSSQKTPTAAKPSASKQWPPPPPSTSPSAAASPLSPRTLTVAAGSASPVGSPISTATTPLPARPPPPLTPSGAASPASRLGGSTASPAYRYSLMGTLSPKGHHKASASSVGSVSGLAGVEEVPGNEGKAEMSLESLLAELSQTAREWQTQLRASLLSGHTAEYHRGMERLSALLEARRRLEFPEPGADRDRIRHEIIELIEGSRKMAEGYMVPRNAAGQVADSNNTGVVELLALHRSMYSALTEESSSVWMQKGQERKLKSFKKQENNANMGGSGNMSASGAGSPTSAAGVSSSLSTGPAAAVAPSSPLPSMEGAGGAGTLPSGSSNAALTSSSGGGVPSTTTRKKFPGGPLQLYLNVKMCIFSVGEATDLFFSLYSNSEGKFITEEYSLALSDQGLPLNLNLLHKMRTVFSNLVASDFENDLWLVCRIYRKGRLVFDANAPKPKGSQRLYRRPFGCAACSLTESNIEQMLGREYEPPNAAMTIYTCADEAKFSRIHELIIAKDRALEPAPRAKGIALGLVLYTGDLASVREGHEETMSADSTPESRKLSFPPRMSAADFRNDLYIHLLGTSFSQDGKKSAKNIEASVRVVLDDGTPVEGCISHGMSDSSPQTEYHSTVHYHLNTPFFAETLRLSIPEPLVSRCHLFLSFWHVSTSKKASCFSYSFLPLTTGNDQGALLLDGEYKLPTYKPFAHIEQGPAGSKDGAFYLRGADAKPKLEARKEHIVVRTQLLSTIKSQNLVIHNVLKLNDVALAGGKEEPVIVRALMDKFIAGSSTANLSELARYMRELFTTFFTLLATPSFSASHTDIFRGALHLLHLMTDRSSKVALDTGCIELMEEYIGVIFLRTEYASRFSKLHGVLATLTRDMLARAAEVASGGSSVPATSPDLPLLKLSKSLHYLIKLLIHSRDIELSTDESTNTPAAHASFKAALVELLQQVKNLLAAESRDELGLAAPTADVADSLLSSTAPTPSSSSPTLHILPAQCFLVRSVPQSIPDLLCIFELLELATLMRDLIKVLPRDSIQNINKLYLLRDTLTSHLGVEVESRKELYPLAIETLVQHLMSIDSSRALSEAYMCIAILNHMLDQVSKIEGEFDELDDAPPTDRKQAMARKGTLTAVNGPPRRMHERAEQFLPLLRPLVHVCLAIQQNALGMSPGGEQSLVVSPLPLKAPNDSILRTIRLDLVVDSITCLWTLLNLLSDVQMERYVAALKERPMLRQMLSLHQQKDSLSGINGTSSPPRSPTNGPMSPAASAATAAAAAAAGGLKSELQLFLEAFLSVCSNALQLRCYPDLWVVMNMMECTVITKMLSHLSKPIRTKILGVVDKKASMEGLPENRGEGVATKAILALQNKGQVAGLDAATTAAATATSLAVNHRIVRSFLCMILDLLMHDQLKIELFPPRKKEFVRARYGDLRGKLIEEFMKVWSALGKNKVEYIEHILIVKLFELARGASKDGTTQGAAGEGANKTAAAGAAAGASTPASTPKSTPKSTLEPSAEDRVTAGVHSSDESYASREFALNIYFDMLVASHMAATKKTGTGGTLTSPLNLTTAAQQAQAAANGGGSSGDQFTQVERHTIDALYNLANLNRDAGQRFMDLIYDTMAARFNKFAEGGAVGEGIGATRLSSTVNAKELLSEGMGFLKHIARMYELMSSLIQFPHSPLYEDERTNVSLKLMSYLESSGHVRKDMYSKYVQYLVDLHVSLNNYTEAGCTTMQAIRMLSWTDLPLAALQSTLSSFPAEKEKERKEKLYHAAIDFFRKGEDWERAIQYGEELRHYYQFLSFDYLKLSELLRSQADCFQHIVTQERFYPSYFRVCYFGSGLPEELTGAAAGSDPTTATGKEFVYRGLQLEPVMDFTGRIKRKWPDAKILMSSDRPSAELFAAHKQIISITTLTRASVEESQEVLKSLGVNPTSKASAPGSSAAFHPEASPSAGGVGSAPSSLSASPPLSPSSPSAAGGAVPALPKHISTYRSHNDVCVFVYAKGVQKDKSHPNEFKHLWVSKSCIVTAEPFPSNRRRMEVIARKELLLSPIENAISTMTNKTSELREKIDTVSRAPLGAPVDVGPLSMNLNGMIDAAVNGGTQKYIEAFLCEEFIKENSATTEEAAKAQEQQQRLKDAIRNQIEELKVGLDVFGERCDEKLRGLYDHLRGFYSQMVTKTQSVVA